MRHKILYRLILILATPCWLYGQEMPYRAGEKVNYYIHYGFISGGVASLKIVEDTIFGQDVLYAVLSGRTTGVADAIYKVRDYYRSFIDPATGQPLKAIRDISEGKYNRYNEVVYDQYTRSDSAILHSMLTGTHITPMPIYDVLSSFYWLRSNYLAGGHELEQNEVITIMTWFTDELYPIQMRFKGYETVKTPLGKIECLAFNPVTEVGRLFETEDDMTVWISNDKNYLPVKIRFDIFVGKVTVDIESHEGLAWPLNIIKK